MWVAEDLNDNKMKKSNTDPMGDSFEVCFPGRMYPRNTEHLGLSTPRAGLEKDKALQNDYNLMYYNTQVFQPDHRRFRRLHALGRGEQIFILRKGGIADLHWQIETGGHLKWNELRVVV